MNSILLAMITIYLPRIQAENVYLKQGEESLYSIFAGDTLTMLCPLILPTSSDQIRWSYNNDIPLSIGLKLKLDQANFHFNVSYTNKLKDFIYLRIYNISVNEQMKFKCYYKSQTEALIKYHYNIRLANIPNISILEKNGQLCCAVNGTNINTTDIIWEQRTLFDEHIRFVKSVNIRSPEMSCINISGILTYITEGKYICNAQVFVKSREQTISGTSSIEIKHIQDRPFCIQDNRIHRTILGSNISIIVSFYSKPEYYHISFRREDSEFKLDDTLSISSKNISLDIFNVTVVVSGYELAINITEFRKDDIGNYTIHIYNEFGHAVCTVQLQPQDKKVINISRYPSGSVFESQSIIFLCKSMTKTTTHDYAWTKNGMVLSNTSSFVLKNVTQADNGNYTCTCRMENKQVYLTKNEVLIVIPLKCSVDLTETSGILEMKSVLSFGVFTISFLFLVASLICNVFIHLYCKKLTKVPFETDENEINRDGIELTEIHNEYHTINEDNFQLEEIETGVSSSFRESLDFLDVQFNGTVSDRSEQPITEDDYLHPYCTTMQNTIDIHEYSDLGRGVDECDDTDIVVVVWNQEIGRIYENLKI